MIVWSTSHLVDERALELNCHHECESVRVSAGNGLGQGKSETFYVIEESEVS